MIRAAKLPRHHFYDLLARKFLSDREVFIDLLQNYLDPSLVNLLDLDRLVYESPIGVDANLKERLSDIRYSTVFKNTRIPLDVLIFLEHQSASQSYIPFRLLRYIVDAYSRLLPEFEKGGGKNRRLFPYPLAIVLHHGKMPWKGPLAMKELIGVVPGVDPLVLNFPVHLIDLAELATDNYQGDPALRALLDALQAASRGRLEKRFEAILSTLAGAGKAEHVRDKFRAILSYCSGLSQRLPEGESIVRRVYGRFFGREEGESMAKTWREELIDEGIVIGLEKGLEKGLEQGLEKGLEKGLEQGLEKGLKKGKAEGKAEGKQGTLLNILAARFGPVPAVVKKRLGTVADPDLLDELAVLAATCASLNEFKNEAGMGRKEREKSLAH